MTSITQPSSRSERSSDLGSSATFTPRKRRRQALGTWNISEDAWPTLAARRSLMARPETGDRKRQIASVYVWTRVTSGEPSFAPPIEAAQPTEVQEDWRRSWHVTWRDLQHASDPRSHYTRFRAELNAFAAALAKATDHGRQLGITVIHRAAAACVAPLNTRPTRVHGGQVGVTVTNTIGRTGGT